MTNLARIVKIDPSEENIDPTNSLQSRGSEVMKILECLRALENYPQWRAFKKFVLDDERERVMAQISTSSGEKTISLQGELRILRRFLDFGHLIKEYETELIRIKQSIDHYGSKKDRSNGQSGRDSEE